MYHVVLNIVCFETFSEKRKENKLHRKYMLFWGCWYDKYQQPISSHNFTDTTNLIILFHLPWFTMKKIDFFFSKNHIFCIFIFLCCMFLLERDQIFKKWYVTVPATQFPTKWCPFQPFRSKTVGGDIFLVAKSYFFRRGEKHIKI